MPDDLRTRIIAAMEANFDDAAPSLSMVDMADAVIRELYPEHRCELCGRTGTQKFSQTETGWVCRNIYACERRIRR